MILVLISFPSQKNNTLANRVMQHEQNNNQCIKLMNIHVLVQE